MIIACFVCFFVVEMDNFLSGNNCFTWKAFFGCGPQSRHINFSSLRTPFIHFPSLLSTSILRHRDSFRDKSRTNGTATEAINSFWRSFAKAASVINNNYRTFLNRGSRERLVNFHKFLIRPFCYQSVKELIFVRGIAR